MFFTDHYLSPAGMLIITSDETHLHRIDFTDEAKVKTENSPPVLRQCILQLDEYFNGRRKIFSLPLQTSGTPFQQKIWQLVAQIPFGETRSYLDISIAAGDKNLMRAVGAANGANKLPIVIPCHRVVGANGSLTGYAGGLWRKAWLLRFEQKDTRPELFDVITPGKNYAQI